jgi:outer membrane protein OmpA-like peptidoglycan-associated protein
MLKHLRIFFLLSSLLSVTSCAVAMIGIGAAVGTVVYKNGKLIKTYQEEYNRSVKASRDTLMEFKIPLTDNLSDELKTILKAKRPDGTPVEIIVVRISPNLTEVGVRTGVLGVWDKRASEQIQDSISKKLSSGPGQTSGNTADSERKNPRTSNNETTPKASALIKKNGSTVKNSPTDISTDKEDQEVLRKSIKKRPDFVIYFEANTNELTEDAVEKLNTIVEVINAGQTSEVRVNGFSDSNGTSSFIQMVSESRANTVKFYLIGKGIQPKKIIAKGFGSGSPVASNKYENTRKLNNRVEIELVYQ